MNWAELLERLKGAHGLSDKDVASIEKRDSWRVFRKVTLEALRGQEAMEIVATNFGPGGMRAETPRRLRRDDPLTIRLATGRGDARLMGDETFEVRVVWCRARKSDGRYEVGLVFAGNDAENRLSAARFLLDECNVSIQNPREKRRAPRVQAEQMSAAFATGDGEVTSARVLDLAVGGVQLLSPRPVPRGAELDLKILLARDLPPLLCRGTVVRSGSEGLLRTVELAVAFTDVGADHKDRLVAFVSRLLRG